MNIESPSQHRQHWLVGLGVAAVVFVLLLSTATSVGVTWDEPIYSQAAENAARWFGTLLRGGGGAAFEQTAFGVGWGLVNEHPPLVRVLNGLGWALTRGVLPAPTAHRVGSMALAAFTIGVLAAATARRSGIAAGLFAAAAVVTMPRVFFTRISAHLISRTRRPGSWRPWRSITPPGRGGGGRLCWPAWGSAWRC